MRFVCGPALLQIVGALGHVRLYLRKNGEQVSIALPRFSVPHGELVEDGTHLRRTESSEIRKRVAAGSNETSISHNGGLCDADDFGEGRDGWPQGSLKSGQ